MSDYKYYNHNPGDYRINDCVSRAIGTGTGLSYKTVNRLLSIVAENYECDKLCVCCYKHLLSHYFGYKKHNCKQGVLVKDVADDFSTCTLIIRIDGHLTCAKNGTVLDTWDCSDYEADCFWIVD
jgi:hypothetical protein